LAGVLVLIGVYLCVIAVDPGLRPDSWVGWFGEPGSWLTALIVAGIAGLAVWLRWSERPGGFLVSIIIGVIGAYLGTWIARQLNLPPILTLQINQIAFPVVWAVIGALVLVAVLSLLRGPRRFYRGYRGRRRSYRYR